MKCFTLLAIFIILNVSICYSLTCDEAKSLLNIEYEGNCCDLQQINCDENNEKILSIESLLDEDYYENESKLYRRKGGGHGGGGHSSGGHSSSSHSSSGSSSSSSSSAGYYYGNPTTRTTGGSGYSKCNSSDKNDKNNKECNAAYSLKSTSFLWIMAIMLLVKLL
eukprot:jgi/Orpsp1_1/1192948/evm.model.d7180000097096.1